MVDNVYIFLVTSQDWGSTDQAKAIELRMVRNSSSSLVQKDSMIVDKINAAPKFFGLTDL